ncbi:MAG TPA: DUF2975 domain-containing protein [Bacteroidia bacterium]
MKTTTEKILMVLNVLTWIAFIGLMVEAGILLVSFILNIANVKGAWNEYASAEWVNLRDFSLWQFSTRISFIVIKKVLQAYTAYLVIKVMSKIKLESPFTVDVAKMIERISYFIVVSWSIGLAYNIQTKWLNKFVAGLSETEAAGEYLFLAGVVFVIAQIFKKGVQIQTENELTV